MNKLRKIIQEEYCKLQSGNDEVTFEKKNGKWIGDNGEEYPSYYTPDMIRLDMQDDTHKKWTVSDTFDFENESIKKENKMNKLRQIIKEEIRKVLKENENNIVNPNAIHNTIKQLKLQLAPLEKQSSHLWKKIDSAQDKYEQTKKMLDIEQKDLRDEMGDDPKSRAEDGLGSSYGDDNYYVNKQNELDVKWNKLYKLKNSIDKDKQLAQDIDKKCHSLKNQIKSNENSLKTSMKLKDDNIYVPTHVYGKDRYSKPSRLSKSSK